MRNGLNRIIGTGIKVLSDPRSEAPRKQGVLVQRYIEPPFLVNGLKCSFRLYVVCTDLEPLRLYLH